MRLFPFAILLACCFGCFKKKDEISGTITLAGKVTDIVSNAPISNTVVRLVGVEQIHGIFGYQSRDITLLTDTTDAAGSYSFSYNSTGRFYEFELVAEPLSRSYVSSIYSVGDSRTENVSKPGNYTVDIVCHRSSIARVILTNISPIDTVNLGVYAQTEGLSLRNFYKDSIVYLKLISRPVYSDNFRVTKFANTIVEQKVSVSPWDTTTIQVSY